MADRNALLRELDDARALLLAAVEGLPDAAFAQTVAAGRDWTVADVLNHVAAWDDIAAESVIDLAAGRPPRSWVDDVDDWNARAVEDRRDRTPGEILSDLHRARTAFRAALDAAPEAVWTAAPCPTPTGGTVDLPDICHVWAHHDSEHAAELRAFRDRDPGAGPQTS